MYSPVDVSRIQYMTKNKQQTRLARRKRAQNQLVQSMARVKIAPPPKKKKNKPFATVGQSLGTAVGSLLGSSSIGGGVGRWLGKGIGSIFGSGDYEMVGQSPSYNVLSNGNQIPKFSSTRATNIVCHREFLGDITGTTVFTNRRYPINPGSPTTFPWLATIAQNYQQYRIHGIIFEFRPLITDFITNGAPGVVIMATNYNADEPLYTTKQAMENSEFAVSVKPTRDLIHAVECAPGQTVLSELYVRPGGLASNLDLKFTDLGNFQFATQGNPNQLLGELWCSYNIEFFKPLLPNDVGGNVQSQSNTRNGVSNAAPLGTGVIVSTGDLVDYSVPSPLSLSFIGQPDNFYVIQFSWFGSVSAAFTAPAITYVNAVTQPAFFNDANSNVLAPSAGTVTNSAISVNMIKCSASTPSLITVTLGAAGGLPTGTATVDILITQVSDNI
jgi:hypothetical protein